jgi:small basic protein
MKNLKINHGAVWILVLIQQIIGFMWYSPFAFASKWVELMGKSQSDFENINAMPFVVSIIGSVILTYSMAYLLKKLGVDNFVTGMFYAFIFWFGFLFAEVATFNSFELRPLGLTLIDTGKSLLTFLVTGFILGMWSRKDAPEDTA